MLVVQRHAPGPVPVQSPGRGGLCSSSCIVGRLLYLIANSWFATGIAHTTGLRKAVDYLSRVTIGL